MLSTVSQQLAMVKCVILMVHSRLITIYDRFFHLAPPFLKPWVWFFWWTHYDFLNFISTLNIYYLYYTTLFFPLDFHASFQPPRLHNTDITRSNIRKLKPGNSQEASNNGRSRDDHVTPRCRFSKSQIYFTTLEKFQNFINDVKNFEIRIG